MDTDCWDPNPRQVRSGITYAPEDLCRFITMDSNPCLTFYGGEPHLSIDAIQSVMETVSGRCRFMLHTNGTLLDQVPGTVLTQLETIIVSIDGREKTHDRNRGRGTYRQIVENCKKIHTMKIPADFIGRMTVTEDTDIYRTVHALYEVVCEALPRVMACIRNNNRISGAV